MNKKEKLELLFDPEKEILLSDILAPLAVRKELMNYLHVETEKDLLDELNLDFYYLSFRDLSQNETLFSIYTGPELPIDAQTRKCPFGISWRRSVFDDKFGVDEAMEGPFYSLDLKEEDILSYSWPDPEWFDYTKLREKCRDFEDKIIIGGLWSAIHGDSYRMMGYENFLMNIALNKSLVKTLVDRLTDFYLEANRKYFEELEGKMDIFFMGNDFGAQNGLLISEEDWLDIYYENYRRLIDLAHSFGLKVMVHSCGGIRQLLPYFINLGVDILDPVQTTAAGMQPEVLVNEYGREIVFHGGIDTQQVLPYSKKEDVYNYSIEMINVLNKYGKYILAPSNNIMPGTPVENILAVYQAANEWKKIKQL